MFKQRFPLPTSKGLKFLLLFFFLSHYITAQSCFISGDALSCPNDLTNHSANFTPDLPGGLSYQWTVPDVGQIEGQDDAVDISIRWASAGSYALRCDIFQFNELVSFCVFDIEIHPEIYTVLESDLFDTGFRQQYICLNESAQFTASAYFPSVETNQEADATYSWEVTGSTIYTADGQSVDVNFNNLGVTTICVTATVDAGCLAQSCTAINVLSPDVNLGINANPGD